MCSSAVLLLLLLLRSTYGNNNHDDDEGSEGRQACMHACVRVRGCLSWTRHRQTHRQTKYKPRTAHSHSLTQTHSNSLELSQQTSSGRRGRSRSQNSGSRREEEDYGVIDNDGIKGCEVPPGVTGVHCYQEHSPKNHQHRSCTTTSQKGVVVVCP